VAEYGIFTATKIAVAAVIGSFAPQIPPDQRRSLKQGHKSFIITINVGRKISATENLHFDTQSSPFEKISAVVIAPAQGEK
jgi:hypothetical protein